MAHPPELPADILAATDLAALQQQHPDQLGRLHVKLTRLARIDRERRVFGSWHHDYRLGPRLPEASVAAWEAVVGVRLPAVYREFLLAVGDGGAGPAYGLAPLGSAPSEEQRRDMRRANLLPIVPGPRGWWTDEEARRFQGAEDAPHSAYSGTMLIGHYGCDIWAHLVVSGPNAGFVWNDNNGDAWSPAGTFGDWYERWLDEALQGRHWSTRAEAKRRRVDSRRGRPD